MEQTYIFATEKPWHLAEFSRRRAELPGAWIVAMSVADLKNALAMKQPRYVFFPHWSYIVESEILEMVECVCFHMTDVPYGRGGTPLQNLIVRGHKETKLTALRMVDALDAGPIYDKRNLSLAGSAAEIFDRAAVLTFDMMRWITEAQPRPTPQVGEPTVFKRRRPDESVLPYDGDLDAIYDHIRMLDAPGYPKAFLEHGRFRVIFGKAEIDNGSLSAEARIVLSAKDDTP